MSIDYEQIPLLLEEGKTADEIAKHFDTTPNSLKVQCSKRKVSLRRPDRFHKKRVYREPVRGALDKPLELSNEVIELLKEKARQLHTHPAKLARDLIEVIVADDLYNAVLDREDA